MIAKKELVVKSNRIIEASYRLTLNEQRIILYAICRTREEQKGLFPHLPLTITADLFLKQFPAVGKQHVYEQLKEAMDNLYDRSVTFYDIDPETGLERVNKTRWISKASYVDGAGRLQVVFTQDVIDHITRLEAEFTTYQLEKVGNMSSAYAVRIYEMLAQYREIGARELNLKWLRDALQIADDEYKLTKNFMMRVLDASVDQINQHSDLKVSYTPKKTGRAITDFVFKIKEKASPGKPRKSTTPSDQVLRNELEKRGQQRICEDSSEEF
ncbi:MAG: replication initiation protein RepM [Gloeotrichia echinulata HAB0833]